MSYDQSSLWAPTGAGLGRHRSPSGPLGLRAVAVGEGG